MPSGQFFFTSLPGYLSYFITQEKSAHLLVWRFTALSILKSWIFFSVKKRYLKTDTFIHLLKQFVRAIKPSPERVVNLFVAFLNCVTSLPHTWILSVPGNRTSTSSSLNGNWSHMLWLSDAFTTYPTWEGPLLFVRFDPELHQSI